MTQIVRPQFYEYDDFIVAFKPTGFNTHSPDLGKKGFVEFLEDSYKQRLYVVHRLDKETSGLLIVAKTSECAKEFAQLFEKHKVKKQYLFLTDRESPQADRVVKTHIAKKGNEFISLNNEESNSETHFSFVGKVGEHFLWRAFPKTGKPHQIRLHALEVGIPILGDSEHQGTPWPQLCLHAKQLELEFQGQEHKWECPSPLWAELSLEKAEVPLIKALEKRQMLLAWQNHPEQCLRLSHLDSEQYRLDQYGEVWFVYWYDETPPSQTQLDIFKKWALHFNKKVVLRLMHNRGSDPTQNSLISIVSCSERWQAKENDISYELRLDSGLSPGLFLDQRNNRHWLSQNCENKSVLNLFSYTSGFSVVAAKSGAAEVVTVDVSANFLEWSKENFKINSLDPEKYEFWNNDVLLFLKGTHRRKRKFDIIICDPPSFGRSKDGVFSLAKQWEQLLTSCLLVLNRGGLILFSTNFEQWTLDQMRSNVDKLNREIPIKITDAPFASWDFESPDEAPLMKSLIIRKS